MAAELSSSEDNPNLDDENLEATDEPSRAELQEMLVGIQISILASQVFFNDDAYDSFVQNLQIP